MSDFSLLVGEDKKAQSVKTRSLIERIGAYLLQPGFVLTVVCVVICSFILYISLKSEAIGPALSFLMMSLTIFAAALTHEILSRRQWEEGLSLRYARMIRKIGHLEDQLVMLEDDNKKLKISVVSLIDQLQEKASVRDQRNYQDMLYDLGVSGTQAGKPVTKPQTDTMTQMMRANSAYKAEQKAPPAPKMTVKAKEEPLSAIVSQTKYDMFDDPFDAATPVDPVPTYPLPEFKEKGMTTTATDIKDVVATAVREDRVDIFLQPTVKLPSRKETFFEVIIFTISPFLRMLCSWLSIPFISQALAVFPILVCTA